MVSVNSIASIASLFGDTSRASMLQALIAGRALTSNELAETAGITPQTASGHLSQLTEAGLLSSVKQGRHRYYRLAKPSIAQLFENLMQVTAEISPLPLKPIRTGPKDIALRNARTCFDHLAGDLGVAIADALLAKNCIELNEDGGFVTDEGKLFFERAAIELPTTTKAGKHSSAITCKPCLDWSVRRPHLAGKLGAALCQHCLEAGWLRKNNGSRALTITPKGQIAFYELFDFRLGRSRAA
jgi:DNA-binding transcriptional ArsR family regulator